MLIGIHALDDLIKAFTETAECFRVRCRCHVLQNGFVVFVNQDNDALPGFLIELQDEFGE